MLVIANLGKANGSSADNAQRIASIVKGLQNPSPSVVNTGTSQQPQDMKHAWLLEPSVGRY